MAITTYIYSAGNESGSWWTDDSYAWDNNSSTYATRLFAKNTGRETTKWIRGTTNNAPTSGNTITKVEVGVMCKVISTDLYLYTVPFFNGSTNGSEYNLNATTSNATYWKDVTNSTNAPSTWSWSDVRNLDIKVYGESVSSDQSLTGYINQFYVRVTSSVTSTSPVLSSKKLHYRLASETTDINIYESECGSDGTSCMTYSLQTCNDGTNVNYCQLTTNLSHSNISKLRVRKGGVTYGVLKTFDASA